MGLGQEGLLGGTDIDQGEGAAEGRFAEPLPTSRPDRLNDPG